MREAGSDMTDVYLELGKKLVFASAVYWPGWSRSGKTEDAALDKLGATAARFAVIANAARIPFAVETDARFKVVELLKGTPTTDFGVPEAISNSDRAPLTGRDAERFAVLLEASWSVFGRVVAGAPASLRKGPGAADEIVTRSWSMSRAPRTCTPERSVCGSMM